MIQIDKSTLKELRSQARILKPTILIGKQGVTPTVKSELEMALKKVNLLKIRFNAERDQIKEWCDIIAKESKLTLIAQVGKTAAFYRHSNVSALISPKTQDATMHKRV